MNGHRPTAVDLFAGAGGLSLGLEQAGFDVVAAVELDPVHAAVHHFNFPNTRTFVGSVTAMSGTRMLKELGLNGVDLVAGGAPCQGFSLMGQRALEDPRNQLVVDFVRMVVELNASYFILENVKGLTVGEHRKFLREVCEEFDALGYTVVTPWKVLNAANHGVPQSRERLFLLGARKGLKLPSYPEATHWLAAPGGSLALLPTPPTCADALSGLPDVDRMPELLDADEVPYEPLGPLSDYARMLRGEERRDGDYAYQRLFDPGLLTSSARTHHSKITQARFVATEWGATEPISRFLKLSPNGISNTLRAGTDSSRGAFTSPRPIHFSHARCVTVREMARLHSYPDWFRFHRTKWHGAREVGNSVPPLLARAVASEVMRAIAATPSVPTDVLPLGSPDLLGMTVQQASDYWGVENPIAGRTQKGSYRKRSQAEVEAALSAMPTVSLGL